MCISGNLVLGPSSCAKHRTDVSKKSIFGMHVQIFECNNDDGVKMMKQKKSVQKKNKKSLPIDLYCYGGTD